MLSGLVLGIITGKKRINYRILPELKFIKIKYFWLSADSLQVKQINIKRLLKVIQSFGKFGKLGG